MIVQRPEVVVGVNGSAESCAALRWAVGHAGRTGAQVTAIAVSERPPLVPGTGLGGRPAASGTAAGTMPGAYWWGAGDEYLAAEAEQWLSDAVAALPPGAADVIESRVERGSAARALLEAARGADLLVLGNHGRSALAGALVVSVAHHCMQHAACPLVLVPAPG